jgi:hypothetical protein
LLTTNAPPTHVRDETQGASRREWVKERGNPVEVAKGTSCGVECVIIPPLRLWYSDTIAVPVSTNSNSTLPITVIARNVYPDCLMKAVAAGSHGWIGDSSGAPQTEVVTATGALCTSSHQTPAFILPVQGYPPQRLGDLSVSRLEISTRKEDMKFNSLAFSKAFVELENYSLTLNDFNFAPNIAPTYDQLFPHLNTQKVLIASRGDRPLIDPKFDWIVDSECTSHICNNKSLFTELTPILSTITTAGEPAQVIGIGTARIRAELEDDIVNFSLLNTLLVPSLPVNLISQSKLDIKFYFSTENGYQVRSRETHELFLEARVIERLYIVNQVREFNTTLLAKENLTTWHKCLGHISMKHLQDMRDGKATGVKFFDNEVDDFKCDACTLGKMHRQPIRNKPRFRSTVSGEVLHWDTCGPMPKSLNGCIYLVIGIDDATHTIFSGTFRSKNIVHKKIQDVISFINNSRGAHTVKTVHSNNGGEFLGAEIREWLTERGIKHTTSAAHTPEHNGVAERAIQTIISMARYLLIASGLPQQFWTEAVWMAVIIYNMVSETANNHQPPQLLWDSSTLDMSKLRTFGCRVMIKDPVKKLGKFVIRTWDGIYLGLDEGSDGHRIYGSQTKQFNNSCDVFFLESQARSEFHSSPLIEKISAPIADEESKSDVDSKGEETRSSSITLHTSSKRDIRTHSDYHVVPKPPTPDNNKDLVDARIARRKQARAKFQDSDSEDNTQSTTLPSPATSPMTHTVPSPSDTSSTSTTYTSPPSVPLRHSTRSNFGKKGEPYWMANLSKAMCAFLSIDEQPEEPSKDPRTHKEALSCPEREKWIIVMKKELDSFRKHNIYRLAKLPLSRCAVGCKWVFKTKRDTTGSITRYKAKLVAQGYTQRKGLDFQETFAPVAQMTSQCIVIITAAAESLELFQIDVKNAYLNGEIDTDIYMKQLVGFEDSRYPDMV